MSCTLKAKCPTFYAPVGKSYSGNLSITGGAVPYTITLIGSLLSGLSLDTTTGAITGTPTTEETKTFTLTITDSGSPQLSITMMCGMTSRKVLENNHY